MTIAADNICSIRNFRDHIKERFKEVETTGKPMVVATYGKPVGIVMSVEKFQELEEEAELSRSLKSIDKSLEQLKEGEGRPMKEALMSIARKHNIDLT